MYENKLELMKESIILILLLTTRCVFAVPSCSLSVVRGLNFGNYQPFRVNSDKSTARLKVKCTGYGQVNYQLTLSTGNSGSYYPRQMTISGSSAQLQYNIYTTSARNKIWGDGNGATRAKSKSKSSPFTKRYTLFGEMPALQTTAQIGSYSDLIIATLDF